MGELIERTYDYVIDSCSLQEKIRNMEVVEDFESRPHKAVSIVVERDENNSWYGASKNARGATRLQWWKVVRKK